MSAHRVIATGLLLAACGGAPPRAAEPEPVAAAEPPPAAEPAPPPEPVPELGDAIGLACGRARARVPAGVSVVPHDVGGPFPHTDCEDPGYPFGVVLEGVAGGHSSLQIARGECTIVVDAYDHVPDAGADPGGDAATTLEENERGYVLQRSAPDGARLHVTITGEAACRALAEETARAIRASLELDPLGTAPGGIASATLSSAGHGIRIPLPPGWVAITMGGMADAYETSYELRAPGAHGRATIYTAWDENADPFRPMRRFQEIVLSEHATFEPAAEPMLDLDCAIATSHPESRIDVSLYVCAEEGADRDALIAALRAARYVAPPPHHD